MAAMVVTSQLGPEPQRLSLQRRSMREAHNLPPATGQHGAALFATLARTHSTNPTRRTNAPSF